MNNEHFFIENGASLGPRAFCLNFSFVAAISRLLRQ